MTVATSIIIFPHDVAARVDPYGVGKSGTWEIDSRKFTVAQEEAVAVFALVLIQAHDLALWVKTNRERLPSTWEIDLGKNAFAQEKTVRPAPAKDSHDIPARVNRVRSRKRGVRHVEGSELLCFWRLRE